ncbi:hypothetical protein NFI96_032325 [Prochilodus magdalenae]|nr:hypothetical protein NFI96_032325 [Prochilodus magdalenae]
MKPNVWNIKDVLNIPATSVTGKSGKGVTTSDYSSLTDSQFLFGSQFWPESSQGFSQEISGPSKGCQPASQEINELKVSTSYHSKPLLFGDSKTPNSTGGKTLGILDRFEEEKRKAKENEMILNGFRQLHEGLENIKRTFLNITEESCDFTKKTVAEGIKSLSKTIQDDLASLKESMTGQAEKLANLQNQTHREMKDSEAKTTLAVKDLNSLVHSLQQDLVSLREDQSKEQSVLGEIQSFLGTIMAAHSSGVYSRPVRMIHSTVQTSPSLVEKFCVISEEKHFCKGITLCSEPITHSEERTKCSVHPVKAESPEKLNTGASFWALGSVSVDKQKQLFSSTAAEKSYCTHSVSTTALSPAITTTGTAGLHRGYMTGAPVHMEPVRPLIDLDKNRLTTWSDVSRQKKMSKRGQGSKPLRRKKRALILPQRRPSNRMASVNIFEDNRDDKQENRVPQAGVKSVSKNNLPPIKQKGTAVLSNRSGCGQLLNPWSWSQDSCSPQMMMEYKNAEQETAKKHNTKTGLWQLFDFISDSD